MEPTLAVVERAGTALGSSKPRRSLVVRIVGVTKQAAPALRCAERFRAARFVAIDNITGVGHAAFKGSGRR